MYSPFFFNRSRNCMPRRLKEVEEGRGREGEEGKEIERRRLRERKGDVGREGERDSVGRVFERRESTPSCYRLDEEEAGWG